MGDKLYRNAAVVGLILLAAVEGLAVGLRQGPGIDLRIPSQEPNRVHAGPRRGGEGPSTR